MSSFEFEITDSAQIQRLWDKAPYATAFTSPEVLKQLSYKTTWWLASKGSETVCAWPVCHINENQIGVPDFTYYVGPVWSEYRSSIPAHRWLAVSTEIYEGFIKKFISNYGAVHACLTPDLHDVRVFDWWNYHEPDKPRFRIRPRYTAILSNLQGKSEDDIRSDFRELRRRELRKLPDNIRRAEKNRISSNDIQKLYAEVMDRQKSSVEKQVYDQIDKITHLIDQGFGDIIAFEESANKHEIVAAMLLLYGNRTANMILNVVSNKWRSSGLPAHLMMAGIMQSKIAGMDFFDFNGANSPNRGDDKHSYGGVATLYFDLKLTI